MSNRRLHTRIHGTWSTYAGSMFSILQNCGMWDLDGEWYAAFLGLTGVAFQFIVDEKCTAGSVTAYDWEKEHNGFMRRLGVTTDICYAFPHYADFEKVRASAIREMKESIDAGRGAVLWGIDAGEFGVVFGYDDDDEVFFVSGIGSSDSRESNPILYANVGKTFGLCYCQYPLSYTRVSLDDRLRSSLQYLVDHMAPRVPSDGAIASGLAAYAKWLGALQGDYSAFGVRYCTGVYTERKAQAAAYLSWASTLTPSNGIMGELALAYKRVSQHFDTLHFGVLQQTFDGWDGLKRPVSCEMAESMRSVLTQAATEEASAVRLAQEALDGWK